MFESAREFRPERWSTNNQELLNLVSFSFSLGPRGCIGKQLSLLEWKVGVIKFMQRYKNLKELDPRKYGFTFAVCPANSKVSVDKNR